MEFKGTKGKWERLTINWDLNQAVFLEDTETEISILNGTKIENHYNAQLISKAPEMLEMLHLVADVLSDAGKDDFAKRVEKLIKEATEV